MPIVKQELPYDGRETWDLQLGTCKVYVLRLKPVADKDGKVQEYIAYLNTLGKRKLIDEGARILAEKIKRYKLEPEVLVTAALKDIAVAQAVGGELGLDEYEVFPKNNRWNMVNPNSVPYQSVTSKAQGKIEELWYDEDNKDAIRGREVGLIGDFYTFGGTSSAEHTIIQRCEGVTKFVGVLFTEGFEAVDPATVKLRNLDNEEETEVPIVAANYFPVWKP